MNGTFTIASNRIVLENDTLEIYHAGFVETSKALHDIIDRVTHYLKAEEFIDENQKINTIHVFDYKGNPVLNITH